MYINKYIWIFSREPAANTTLTILSTFCAPTLKSQSNVIYKASKPILVYSFLTATDVNKKEKKKKDLASPLYFESSRKPKTCWPPNWKTKDEYTPSQAATTATKSITKVVFA